MKKDIPDASADHPVLRIIGRVNEEHPAAEGDAARDHDRVLADQEEASGQGADERRPHEQA
jgi:hypothetical protein